jgi:hypothetical protein
MLYQIFKANLLWFPQSEKRCFYKHKEMLHLVTLENLRLKVKEIEMDWAALIILRELSWI